MTRSFDDTFGGKVLRLIVGRKKKEASHGDPSREVFETVVFVVVLVLMLKLFVAEAFVIPTGSMATTLWGDQFTATCPECKTKYPVSVAIQQGKRKRIDISVCQNCGHQFQPNNVEDISSGDRVLVAKYEYYIRDAKRFDIPVFKFPVDPYSREDKQAMNYIKRRVGLPGETIAIYKGDLYRTTSLTYPDRPRPQNEDRTVNALDLWKLEYAYPGDHSATNAFDDGQFEMIRKSPAEIMIVRRPVFDLDHPPASLSGLQQTRWEPDQSGNSGWTLERGGFRHTGSTLGWVRYRHVKPGWDNARIPVVQPFLITDHLAYNVSNEYEKDPKYWVPDLMVECDAEFGAATDELTLELTRASERYQATFVNGVCRLSRLVAARGAMPEVLAEAPTKIDGAKKRTLRFADFDARLTVWVDDKPLDFGPKADFEPPSRDLNEFRPTEADREQPVRIGANGSVAVSKVKLFRDVYYTCQQILPRPENDSMRDFVDCGVQTFYVQPGHYLCLGDNSASSSDGRMWGLVPERLVLGRAVFVYWPPSRWGKIE